MTDVPSTVRALNRFWLLVGETAGNPAMTLFVQASQAYGAKSAGLALTTARLTAHVQGLRELTDAIEAGDVEQTLAITHAQNERMLSWTVDDIADQQKTQGRRKARRGA